MKLNDAALGLLCLLGGVAIWLSAQSFSRLPNQAYGSETMPLALSALAAGLGASLIVRGALAGAWRPAAARAGWTRVRGAPAALVAALALVVAYIALAGRIGFLPVAVAVMWALMLVMGVRWWSALALSIAAALAVQQAFGRLLLVPLPRTGVLPFLW